MQLSAPTPLWRNHILNFGIREVPLTASMAIRADGLTDCHADPADRFIIATALTLDVTLLTADEQILRWPGQLDRLNARR